MFRNCTKLGGPVHLPSFMLPWCCRAIGPSAGTPGSSAFEMTVRPLLVRPVRLDLLDPRVHEPRFLGLEPPVQPQHEVLETLVRPQALFRYFRLAAGVVVNDAIDHLPVSVVAGRDLPASQVLAI